MTCHKKYTNFIYTPIIGKTDEDILELNPSKETNYIIPKSNENDSLLNKNQDSNNHFILIKYYNISKYPMLIHWYIAYKNIEWHPGTPENDIYVPKNYYNKPNYVSKIFECCTECGNTFMQKKIETDKKFSLLLYNCDTMLGNCVETTLFGIMFVLLVVSIIFKSIIALLFLIVALLSLYFTNRVTKTTIYYEKCRHILKL